MSNSIYINANNNQFLTTKYNGGSSIYPYKTNEIISGTITSIKENTATISLSSKSNINVPYNSIKGEVGEKLTFEVLENSKNGLALKQIFAKNDDISEKVVTKQAQTDEMLDLFKQHNMATDENPEDIKNQEKELEEELKIQQTLKKIQNQLLYSDGNSASIAISELAASGLSIEKISLSTLNSVMDQIDGKPPIEISKLALDNLMSGNNSKNNEIIKVLAENDMPVNDKNIEELNSLLEKFNSLTELDNQAVKEFIESEKPLTLENLYIAKHSAHGNIEPKNNQENLWNDLKSEVLKVFEREEIDVNIDTLKSAKFLIDNQLPVQKDNINKLLYLQNMANSTESFLQEAVFSMQKGESFGEISLTNNVEKTNELYSEYKDVIKNLPKITDSQINIMLNRKIPLTLNNLTNFAASSSDSADVSAELEATSVSTKRQITEIALKLTQESAYRLSSKNLNINTLPLEEALNALKQLENEAYSKNLNLMGADETSENIQKMGTLYEQIEVVKQFAPAAAINVLDKTSDFTIEQTAQSVIAKKVLEDFENLATKVSSKYGDSFSEVKEQFGDLLERLSIPNTEENIKSAQISSRSNMEINEENILQISTILSKLERVSETLHPNIAANMIKEGLDPSSMHVDEVLDYIDEFNGEYGENLKEKIPRFIMEADKKNEYSEEVREGMIAIYRMLNTIEKNDSVALGVTVKSGADVTLGNLLEGSKYFSRTKASRNDIDYSAGDNETNKVRVNNSENNIRNILENATKNAINSLENEEVSHEEITELLKNSNMGETADNINKANMVLNSQNENNDFNLASELLTKFEYNHENIEKFSNKVEPQLLSELMNENNDMNNKEIRELLTKINEMIENGNATNSDEIVNAMKYFSQTSPKIINFINDNNLPLNFKTTKSVANMLKNPDYMSDVVGELSDNLSKGELEELMSSLDLGNLKNGNTEELFENAIETIEDIKEREISPEAFQQLNLLQTAIYTQNTMQQNPKNDWIQLPISFNDSVAGLNMYVVNDDAKDVYFSLNTANLGNVNMLLKNENNTISLQIISENQENIDFLGSNKEDLINTLTDIGFEIGEISFNVISNDVEASYNNAESELSDIHANISENSEDNSKIEFTV